MADEDETAIDIDPGDQSVFVAANVEDREWCHEISGIECYFYFREVDPLGLANHAVPPIQWFGRIRVI